MPRCGCTPSTARVILTRTASQLAITLHHWTQLEGMLSTRDLFSQGPTEDEPDPCVPRLSLYLFSFIHFMQDVALKQIHHVFVYVYLRPDILLAWSWQWQDLSQQYCGVYLNGLMVVWSVDLVAASSNDNAISATRMPLNLVPTHKFFPVCRSPPNNSGFCWYKLAISGMSRFAKVKSFSSCSDGEVAMRAVPSGGSNQ